MGQVSKGFDSLGAPVMSLADMFPGYCEHCGGVHEGECGVKEATRHILEGYTPRGATAGFECPNGHGDGVWHWWPRGGAKGFSCEVCGVVVDQYTGEWLDQAERDRRLAERGASQSEVVEHPSEVVEHPSVLHRILKRWKRKKAS